MRCLKVCLGILISVSSHSAFAEDNNKKEFGISYGGSTGLAIRKALNETALIYAGIGLGYDHANDSYSSGSSSSIGNYYFITLGTRRFLSIDKLSKFIDVELTAEYDESRSSVGFNSHGKGVSAYAAYGIEYFLTSNLSIEGKAGLSVSYSTHSSAGSSSTFKSTSFPKASTAITYYW